MTHVTLMPSRYVTSSQHGKQALSAPASACGTAGCVIHVFRVAAGPGDPAFETLAVIGPFESSEGGARALEERDWVALDASGMEWKATARRCRLYASVLELGGSLPGG